MASNIDDVSINPNYPVAGQDNDPRIPEIILVLLETTL